MTANLRLLLHNHWPAQRILMLLTAGWVVYKAIQFVDLLVRPSLLFVPSTWLHQLVLPSLPPAWLFWGVCSLAIMCIGMLLCTRHTLALRAGLSLLLLYINLPQWSYGFLSHVGHHLILAHVLAIFLPLHCSSISETKQAALARSIQWYHGGLLSTFALSAAWKLRDVLLHQFITFETIHWLWPDAAYRNAIASFRMYDLPLDSWALQLYGSAWLWQLGFVCVSLVQLFLPVLALRARWHSWILLFLLFFFVSNGLLINTWFVASPLVFVALLFPYHWLRTPAGQ